MGSGGRRALEHLGHGFDPIAILRVLARHEVRFVAIGGTAGRLLGSALTTDDVDILYERSGENIGRLAAALAELAARRRDLDPAIAVPRLDAQTIRNGMNFLLTTRYGDLDCLGETASGRFTYEQMAPTADRYEVEDFTMLAVSLDELIRMKRAAGRPEDKAAVEHLSALRREREGQD